MDSDAPLRASWSAPLAADRLRRRYSAADSAPGVSGAGSLPSTSASAASSPPRPALQPTGSPGVPPRLPYCIVWTPLPFITWLLPFIGHMGICDSRGAVYDFAGPYTIGVDEMAFSAPTRYLVLDPAAAAPDARFREAALARAAAAGGAPLSATGEAAAVWDAAVDAGADAYCRRMHNICCDNCHHHVARTLNAMRFGGRDDWGQVRLAAWLFFHGKYTSAGGAVYTWAPFALLVVAIVLLRVLL